MTKQELEIRLQVYQEERERLIQKNSWDMGDLNFNSYLKQEIFKMKKELEKY